MPSINCDNCSVVYTQEFLFCFFLLVQNGKKKTFINKAATNNKKTGMSHTIHHITIIRQMGRKSMTWIQIRHIRSREGTRKMPPKHSNNEFDTVHRPLWSSIHWHLLFFSLPLSLSVLFDNAPLYNEQPKFKSTTVSWWIVLGWALFWVVHQHNATVSPISFLERTNNNYMKLNRIIWLILNCLFVFIFFLFYFFFFFLFFCVFLCF